ncbi:MAG: cytidylate kinase-like family protein [Eubacteriales bacterium]
MDISMENYVITIARGFGSGGKQIALQLAKKLGIECYENRVLYLASEMCEVDNKKILDVNEKLEKKSFSKVLREIPRQIIPLPITRTFKSEDLLFEAQAEIIRNLAKTESCVIVGKCADYILQQYDNVISIYIEAPRFYCVKRLMEKTGCEKKEAHMLIEKTDKYRGEYYKYYTKGNYWTNPVNYDMTLNSEKLGETNCIEMIKQAVRLKLKQDI